MTNARFDRFRLAVVIPLVLSAGPAAAQSRASQPKALVPATFGKNIQDSLGHQWDIDQRGTIRYGTNRGFSSAGQLIVNGSAFSPSQQMMTADGKEYVLTWTRSGVQITRRVRVDVKTATLRYVEIFHNPGNAPVTLDVKVMTNLRTSVKDVLTDTGRVISGGGSSRILSASPLPPSGNVGVPVLGDKDCGLLITRSSSSYPAVLVYLAGARSKLKPTLQRQGSYQFLFTYPVTVPAKKKVALVHGLAQRKFSGTPNPKTLAKQFQPFQSRDWTRDLPSEMRRLLLNAGRPYYAEETPRGPVLQGVMNLAAYWDVERGKADVLVQDEDTRLPGAVRGSGLTVDTRYGKTAVPLQDVALLIGGGGVGRPMRVYLRNGEVLVGPIHWEEMTLEAESGLEIELIPKHVGALFMHTDPADGKPASEVVALLKTHHGDQLAVSIKTPSKLHVLTAWGPIELALEQIDYLYPTREPQPIHRLILNNRSRLSVILRGGELDLLTPRFGSVKMVPGAIARLASVKPASTSDEEDEDEEEELKVPHCRLVGENLLVGGVGAAKLELLTAAGVAPLDSRLLRLMERQDEEDERTNPPFTFELVDGGGLVGRLRSGVFPIRALGKVWNLPACHVLSFRQPEEAAASTPPEPDAADKPAPGAPGEKTAPSEELPGDPFDSPPAVEPPAPKPPAVPAPATDDPFG